jgi:hypothetical protein
MQSVLPLIGRGYGHRALIYDAKQDVLSVLAGMPLQCPIHTLNPLDARAVGWDMAADIRSPAAALQVAAILIPDAKTDNNPFFANAARHLLGGALNALIQRPERSDVPSCCALRDPSTGCSSAATTPFPASVFRHRHVQNILSTVLTPRPVIAAAWDQAED